MNGFLKLHRFPEKWQTARLRCQLEGGILASPTNPREVSAMKEILNEANMSPDAIYTGIHATYSNGDFTTLQGIPLSKMDLAWERGEPKNFGDLQNCVIMDSHGILASVNCGSDHPYSCFKPTDKMLIHNCHPGFMHSDYRFDNRTGSCYKFHKESRSWHDAFKTCMAEDAHLTIINSDLESDVIKQLYEENPPHSIPGDHHKDAASVGFSKWKELGEWYTIHGQSLAEAGFSMFNSGEPNNVGDNEWCGSVWRNGLFNDHNCDRLQTFICEKYPLYDVDEQQKFDSYSVHVD